MPRQRLGQTSNPSAQLQTYRNNALIKEPKEVWDVSVIDRDEKAPKEGHQNYCTYHDA
jgi:hypothetical protein